ncbi:hypothetical protein GWK41_00840 [Persephonella atlantica]|uniref:DUF2208 domain-containing protein n=1 Tax=Persephonella atlantica TaxID=2699429 RepID=A0ABS1GF99_9AQUI|nr:hypothetical protein [Persephonella atlantica]MBK3331607.1 hypothetical protein [Persephonella atlantica]
MGKNPAQLFEAYPLEIDIISYLVYAIVFILVLLLFILSVKKFPYRNIKLYGTSKRKEIKIDLKNPKKTAYTITYLIHNYETPYNRELLKRLEKHKYRKKVSSFDRETVELIKKFVEYVKLKDA